MRSPNTHTSRLPRPEPGSSHRQKLATFRAELGVWQNRRYRSLHTMSAARSSLCVSDGLVSNRTSTHFHPLPQLWGSRSRTQCRALARQTNRPNLSPPAQWTGSTSWTEKWATPKRRFAREARPLVSVNKYRRAKNGAELQVTERTHPRCREDFGSSHLHANAQNPYKPVHTDAHKVVRGNPRRQDSPQTLLPLPTKTQAAKPL